MKFYSLVILSFAGLVCAATLFPRYEQAVVAPSVAYITNSDGAACTGFVAAEGFVVTAAHCVPPFAKTVEVAFVAGRGRGGLGQFLVVKRGDFDANDGHDFAILSGDTQRRTPYEFEPTSKPMDGQKALHFRSYAPDRQVAIMGTFNFKDDERGLKAFLGAPIRGDSGGPILSADSGKVVGIVVELKGLNGSPIIGGYFVPYENFAKELSDATTLHRPGK